MYSVQRTVYERIVHRATSDCVHRRRFFVVVVASLRQRLAVLRRPASSFVPSSSSSLTLRTRIDVVLYACMAYRQSMHESICVLSPCVSVGVCQRVLLSLSLPPGREPVTGEAGMQKYFRTRGKPLRQHQQPDPTSKPMIHAPRHRLLCLPSSALSFTTHLFEVMTRCYHANNATNKSLTSKATTQKVFQIDDSAAALSLQEP